MQWHQRRGHGELIPEGASRCNTNMKAFILLAIVATAVAEPEAEADPQLLYGGYYGGYYGHYPYAYNAYALGKSAPCVNAANQPVPCAAYNGYAKRDAEAEAEADPAYLYGGYYGGYGAGYYGHPYGYGYGYGYPGAYYGYGVGVKSAPCVNYANVPVPCA